MKGRHARATCALAAGVVGMAAWLFGQTTPAGTAVLTIDQAESRVEIGVGKSGLFGFAGHAHEVVAPAVSGRVVFEASDWRRSSVSLEFDASALRVTGKGEPPADVPEVQRVMLSTQVLDVTRFPSITFQSGRVTVTAQSASSATVLVEGEMTLHGTRRPVAIRAEVTVGTAGSLTARGSFPLKQSDYGITPVTAGGGTVRVRDELDVRFALSAKPSPPPG